VLTPEQEQAVARRSGSLLLSAGAGSGKTSVLAERFARAVCEDGVAPAQILAITFTERAAGELRERIRARLLELGERDAARQAEAAPIGTFHGFCARLLRAHPLAAGVDPAFEIVEEGLAGRLRRLAFREALAGLLDGEPREAVELVAAFGADALERIVLDAHARLRSQGQTEPRLPPVLGDERAVRACRLIDELLRRFAGAYAAHKRARRALDFDDLELCARDLLGEHADVRRTWAERLQMLMVDELQDTNPRQLELLELLQRDNLFTVGDELQSIYGFRHADVSLFGERRRRLAAQGAALRLTHNFRSRAPILAAVDRIFAGRMGEHYAPLVPAREQSPMDGGEALVELLLTDCRGWDGGRGRQAPARALPGAAPLHAQRGKAREEALEDLPEATPWRVAEAHLLAARVAQLVEEGHAQAGDVAVLLRGLGDLPLYESALRAAGLPTLAAAGGFWGHQQVGDLLAYLRALANPLDELALYSTLACPLAGLSGDGLALIALVAREHGCGAWQAVERHAGALGALLGDGDGERLSAFREWFAGERRGAASQPLAQSLRRAIRAGGYETYVLSLRWGERRLANVHKLIRLARAFEAQEGRDLRGFLDHVAHLGEALGGREAEAPACETEHEAVRLMSIHAAKGLEFPVVCVADLGRSPRLAVPDLIVERDGRLGLRLPVLGEAEPVHALDFERLREELRAAQQAEEDRILYVAVTRARERLLLSGALDFARWPAPRPGAAPAGWLASALLPDAPALASGGGGLTVDLGDGLLVRCLFNRAGAQQTLGSLRVTRVLDRRSAGAEAA
jgi:ATP-dependent helicase/nuclease subunit A